MAVTRKDTLQRKIHFYRVDAGKDDAGRPIPFDASSMCGHIDGLQFETGDRYAEDTAGNATLCWIDRHVPHHRIRLATIRRVDLPQLDQRGRLSPLGIPEGAGLAEPIHIVFFPNNIVGADFNFYGPRLSRLRDYLAEKADGVCPKLDFQPLLRPDVADQLDKLADIRMIRLKIDSSYIDTVREADENLGAAFRAAAEAGMAREVTIILQPDPKVAKGLLHKLIPRLSWLSNRNDIHDKASAFSVSGRRSDTGRVELVDLLSAYIIAKKEIIRADPLTRALDPGSAYDAIEAAYEELEPQLERAAGIIG